MKLKNRVLAVFTAALLTVTALGIGVYAADDEVKPRSVRITNRISRLSRDKEHTLDYTILPDDADDNGVDWSSSDEDVIEVYSDGTIYAVAPGEATIKVKTENGKTDSITIRVPGATSSDSDSSSSRDSNQQDTDISRSSTASTAGTSTTTDTGTTQASTTTMPRETLVAAMPSANGGTLVYKGYGFVSAETLQAAAQAGKGSIAFDTMSGSTVNGRVTINPANAANLTGTIALGVYTSENMTGSVQATFNRYFSNAIKVIRCDQDSFGMTVRIAAKIGSANASNLNFYKYNPSTNKYNVLPVAEVKVDSNGYVHFNTNYGGYIIVSNGALASK